MQMSHSEHLEYLCYVSKWQGAEFNKANISSNVHFILSLLNAATGQKYKEYIGFLSTA